MSAVQFLPVDARLDGLYWIRFRTYDFAHALPGCVIFASETSRVASFAPFVFLRTKHGYLPYVIFSPNGEGNLFVRPDGRWRGSYVPAKLRSHPFSLSGSAEDGAFVVRRDAIFKFGMAGALPFVEATGELSAPVREIQQFLLACSAEMEATKRAMRKVARLNLLVRPQPGVFSGNTANRFFVVDWKSAKANRAISRELSKDISLQRVLHAHAVSLGQVNRLKTLEQGLPENINRAPEREQDIEEFLDAVGGSLSSDR